MLENGKYKELSGCVSYMTLQTGLAVFPLKWLVSPTCQNAEMLWVQRACGIALFARGKLSLKIPLQWVSLGSLLPLSHLDVIEFGQLRGVCLLTFPGFLVSLICHSFQTGRRKDSWEILRQKVHWKDRALWGNCWANLASPLWERSICAWRAGQSFTLPLNGWQSGETKVSLQS